MWSFILFLSTQLAHSQVVQNVRGLHQQYGNIFKHGNRNAASHLWSSFLLKQSEKYNNDKLVELFGGFCAISGSPVNFNGYNRYGLTIPVVPELAANQNYSARFGFMNYCCWPCVCDTQDFLRIDSKTIQTKDQGDVEHFFVTIGNPCKFAAKLKEKFYQPFDRGMVTLEHTAPEVRCSDDGVLKGAVMSDHGYVIIGMFFHSEAVQPLPARYTSPDTALSTEVQPGRMSTHNGQKYQSENEFDHMCQDRKANGYNSGMGEIFRKVAEINTIDLPALPEPEEL